MAKTAGEFLPTRTSLLERLKDWRDNPSWREFFDAYWKLIYGFALHSGLTKAEAEDVVQEAWLRWSGAEVGNIERPAAWLTTVTSRLALDHLRSASRRRETYVGPWLPEPLVTSPGPEETAEAAETEPERSATADSADQAEAAEADVQAEDATTAAAEAEDTEAEDVAEDSAESDDDSESDEAPEDDKGSKGAS